MIAQAWQRVAAGAALVLIALVLFGPLVCAARRMAREDEGRIEDE